MLYSQEFCAMRTVGSFEQTVRQYFVQVFRKEVVLSHSDIGYQCELVLGVSRKPRDEVILGPRNTLRSEEQHKTPSRAAR